jgi:hypothetical protein
MQRNWQAYLVQLAERWARLADGAALPVEEA